MVLAAMEMGTKIGLGALLLLIIVMGAKGTFGGGKGSGGGRSSGGSSGPTNSGGTDGTV